MFFNKKNCSKFAFSMTEILIAIAVLGIMAMISIPIMRHALPSKEEHMHNKITNLVEQITQQMYDNEAYYPKSPNLDKEGFKNTDEITVNGIKYGGKDDVSESEKQANELAKKEKFCKLFAYQISKTGNVTCPVNIENANPTLRSPDGVDWWIPQTTFTESTNGQTKGFVKIKVDVNGTNHGQNCTKGSENCKNPDIFYYYIKTNGSITLSNPTEASDRNYKIEVNIITKDEDGKTIDGPGGIVKIKKTETEYSDSADDFKNLNANTTYELQAIPNSGYLPNWKITDGKGYRKISTKKTKTVVNVEFRKQKKYCINLKISAPEVLTSANFSTYFESAQYEKGCKYIYVGDKRGSYEKESLELSYYKYVGPSQGDYDYQCSSSQDLTVDTNKLSVCNLTPGDYKLNVTINDGYCYQNSQNTENKNYVQDAHLGSKDLDFDLTINKGAACSDTKATENTEPPETDKVCTLYNYYFNKLPVAGYYYIRRENSTDCPEDIDYVLNIKSWFTNNQQESADHNNYTCLNPPYTSGFYEIDATAKLKKNGEDVGEVRCYKSSSSARVTTCSSSPKVYVDAYGMYFELKISESPNQ